MRENTKQPIGSTPEENSRSRFRLGELAELAGVAKKTIHYYLNIGVLPPPERVHERLSLYSENHLKLIKLVRKLQIERKLPLAFISQLFNQGDYDAEALELGFVADVYGKAVQGESLLSEEDKQKAKRKKQPASVSRKTKKDLVKLGITASERSDLAADELKLASLLEQAQELGVPFDIIEQFQTLIGEMVHIESKAFIASIQGDSSYETVINRFAAIDNLLNTFIRRSKSNQLRKHYEKSIEDAPLSMKKLQEKLYVPSDEFLQRQKITPVINKLLKENQQKSTVGSNTRLAESFLAIGDYKKTLGYANRVTKKSKKNVNALVLASAAHALLAETDKAVEMAERAVAVAPKNPKAAAYCAMACIVQAMKVGGIISPGKWLKRSLDYFNKSAAFKPGNERDRIDILLMKGRAFSIMPPSLSMVDDGIDALLELQSILDNRSDEEASWPFKGVNEILYNNMHFYLGEAYNIKGETEKMAYHWERVILSDPASNFGIMASTRLNK